MAFPFKIVEHIIPGQHIREYPKSTKYGQETVFRIAIKQYISLDDTSLASDRAVTIIGAHGNGFPKVSHQAIHVYHLN